MSELEMRKTGEDHGELSFFQQEVDYLTEALSGGTILFRREGEHLAVVSFSEGLPLLTGYNRKVCQELLAHDALGLVWPQDRPHTAAMLNSALTEERPERLVCRFQGKDNSLVWVRASAGPITAGEETLLYVVFSSVAEEGMLRCSDNDALDAVYVVDVNNMELLYVAGDQRLWGSQDAIRIGEKCYQTLHHRNSPCEKCFLIRGAADGVRDMTFSSLPERSFRAKSQHISWGSHQAYIQYLSDVTEENRLRRDWNRLDHYYQTLVRNMPGGMSVIHWNNDEIITTEFVSQGFAAMTEMSRDELMALCEKNALACVHPDDLTELRDTLCRCVENGTESCQMTYRLRKGSGDYLWVRNKYSFIPDEGYTTVYAVFADVTEEVLREEEQRRQYTGMLQHYREDLQVNAIITALNNVTQNQILDVRDQTEGRVISHMVSSRDGSVQAMSRLIPDSDQRTAFLAQFSSTALQETHDRGGLAVNMDVLAILPGEAQGRYLRITEEIISSPDSGDLMSVMSAQDMTMERMLLQTQQRLISYNYDLVLSLDITNDACSELHPEGSRGLQVQKTSQLSQRTETFLREEVMPRDAEKCARKLNPAYMKKRLEEEGPYSFNYSIRKDGAILAKNALVFRMDEALDFMCLARTDITESMREQQALLRMLAQTFETVNLITLETHSCVLHTRESILDDQPPLNVKDFSAMGELFLTGCEIPEEQREELLEKLSPLKMMERLKDEPDGYSFVAEVQQNGQLHYKQISVTWGGATHRDVCAVRRDVTQSTREAQARVEHLRSALALARDANRAKQDFLSSMSHDIRTPMNAIIGMTDLALSHRDDPKQVDESLRIIMNSADHLRDLIGDILDMSRIENGRMVLNQAPFSHTARLHMTVERTQVLAAQRGIHFEFFHRIQHDACVGDPVRIDQIIENLLGNAVKFTAPGGHVSLEVVELPPKNDHVGWFRYTVSDNGLGMSPETLEHLYDPFYREKNRRVDETEGSGLGLPIVKNLVDFKGGVMAVFSTAGVGTRFVVDLPLMFATPDDMAKLTQSHESTLQLPQVDCLKGRRVLLVEDHPVNRIVAQRLLEDAGATVTAAENGEEGLESFQASEKNSLTPF